MKATRSTYLYFANYLFIFLLFISCKELEDISPEREYPRVSTGIITKIDETGITVTGEILSLGKSAVIDHGFVWSMDERGELFNSERKSLGSIAATGTFSADITFGLEKGKTYYIKAYAISEEYTTYSQAIPIKSMGSLSPVITELNPKSATWGDTITVTGENFATIPNGTQVRIGGQPVDVFSLSNISFKFRVPNTVTKEANFIDVTSLGKSHTSKEYIILKLPVITSISPGNGKRGDVLTINGENFGPEPWRYVILFNNTTAAYPLSATTKQLKVKIPNHLKGATYDIFINNYTHLAKSHQQFILEE
jgi:hypothetical protein